MRPLAWLALAALCLFGVVAMSAESCTLWSITYGAITVTGEPVQGTNKAAVCAEAGSVLISHQNATSSTSSYHLSGTSLISGGNQCRITYYSVRLSDGFQRPSVSDDFGINNAGTTSCPPSACEHLTGLPAEGGGSGSWAGTDLCRTDEGAACAVERAGAGINFGGGWFGAVRFTGAECPSGGVEVPEDPPDCVTGPKGQVCISKQDKNCGVFNGEQVCLGEVPDNSCVITSSGAAVCVGDAGPVDGEGETLPPDVSLEYVDPETGEVTDVDYFGPATVNESASGVTGSSSGSGGGGVREAPDTDEIGADFGGGPDDEWDAALGMGGAITAVGGSSWISVMASTADALGGSATCPEITFEVPFMDTTFDLFDSACGYMEPHYTLWTTIMQIAWGFLAIRVFFGGSKN